MNLLQKQSYDVWYSFLVDKLLQWQKQKPNNKDINNCVKGITEIGIFTNRLQLENDILNKKLSLIMSQKNEIILKLQEQLEELQHKIKQYKL
mgnify:CR=1 FL=1|tara:strand:- start:6807 stop:7082 length:276 start_codon:yes stop_codon:yes gene_type:complete